MKKLILILLVALAMIPLLPDAQASDACDNTHPFKDPGSVLVSRDR